MKTLFAAFGALIVTLVPAAANPVTQSVKIACKADYFKHCSMHAPGSEGVRNCMAGVFSQLSTRCVDAIVASPLVETDASRVKSPPQAVVQKVVKRKKATSHYASASTKKSKKYASVKKKGKKYAAKSKRRDLAQRKGKAWATAKLKLKRTIGEPDPVDYTYAKRSVGRLTR